MLSPAFLLVGLLSLSSGIHGAQQTVPQNPHFTPLHPASPGQSISLTLGLPPTNMNGLHTALYDVSDPASPNYGKYLTKAEVEAFVAPKTESVKAVTDWLSQHSIKAEVVSPSGDMLRINVPVSTANALLSANFTEFADKHSDTTLIRTLSYTIPEAVEQHVKFIFPTTQFIPPPNGKEALFKVVQPPKSVLTKKATPPSQCQTEIFPQCLEDFYNIPSARATNPGNNLAVSSYLGEMATEADLNLFFEDFRTDVTPTPNFAIVSVDGGVTSGNGTLEASLDIQYTVGVATGVPTTLYSVGEANAFGFIDLANLLLSQEETPLVLSTSYGFDEDGFTFDVSLAESFCDVYAQLGSRGTTVLFCSGDNGVYSFPFNSTCDATTFGPTFPSGCPFLTSVGGTQGVAPEVAASFSSGGFSNIFARPSYQDGAVQQYFGQLGSTNAGLFNTSGRGFPDISAQSVNFFTWIADELFFVLGTSASTPTWASVIALLNDARLNAGKPSLGFINPLLYSQGAAALNDITIGSNPGCGKQGFPALAGWDPVTGLGTPDYSKLLNLVLSV
ncbi:family S53 protease [Lentinus tigrinus ALCF2SS1-7]|uniref:tripeptidyl-peptidase II n=1 Tax=Lentinus tigrinus ALCF2SS1-6 TaxID=1328759 RepID=A0A5C2RSR2_9APHY|nr:family S53 protease [Lentinus tigrinus ALCF2SS1-6]RPD69209.1 family S53 protease [Lentinus tigrinus ALCF2SS1-7]